MSYRYMRLMLFFDLPIEKAKQKREYRIFVKKLKSFGFYMMQKSVYCKIVLNPIVAESVKKDVNAHLPKKGVVQLLCITERQFTSIEYLIGDKVSDVIDTKDRLVKL